MAVSELQKENQARGHEARGPMPDYSPMFFSIPCPGVRYYTFDYRPALRKMVQRWEREQEVPTAEVH